MRVLTTAFVLVAVWTATMSYPSAETPTAEQVARQAQDRDTGRDSRAEFKMRLFDRQGRLRERTLQVFTLRGDARGSDKTFVRFTYPNDIKNTALLVWEHPQAEDERFLFLPALGRVRRIASEEQQDSFAGSDLSYEDIGNRKISDYTWSFVDENASWVAPDGPSAPAWVVQSVAKSKTARYPRVVSVILKDRLIVVHSDIFNQRGEREKAFDAKRLARIGGIWTVTALTMTNDRERTRTELDTATIQYSVGLTNEDFTRRRLEEPAS